MHSRRLRSARRALLLPALAALLASLACASARILEPGVPVALGPDEGILVVHVDTDTGLAELDFAWLRAAADLPPGEHVLLLAVDRGQYRWSKLRPPGGALRRIRRSAACEFSVAAGRVNFVGMVLVSREGRKIGVRCIDRTASALRLVGERYPGTLERYELVDSRSGRNPFLEEYLRVVADTPEKGGGTP